MMTLRVAIIGAGASGLTAVKCCLDEGLEPVCYERSDHISGMWHYTTDNVRDTARVMRETITNTSKEMHAFSDFPAPREFPVYWHHTVVDQYLNLYADSFNLRKHIRLNMEVVSVRETHDHSSTGQWDVTVKDLKSGTTVTHTFDGVLVCTGPYNKPCKPTFEGLGEFQGLVIHANQYTDSSSFKGKRVLVVGFGNSGAEIAADLCHNAKQVFISARSGGWVLNRVAKRGAPLDFSITRFTTATMPLIRNSVNNMLTKMLNDIIDHQKYGLNPVYKPLRANIAICDHLPIRLITGDVKMKPGIAHFRSHGVEFVDGSDVSDIDAVVLATAYDIAHPFLDENLIGTDKTMLYKAMYPPDRINHTLALLYCFRSRGPVFPVVEMQARVATRVLKGLVKLPPRDEMLKSIRERNFINATTRNPRMTDVIQADYLSLMDELSEMMGCKPNFWKLLLKDWRLAFKVMFGPALSYQFRLQGPGTWGGAREAIMTAEDRTYYPLTEGRAAAHNQRGSGSGVKLLVKSVALLVMIAAVIMYMYVI